MDSCLVLTKCFSRRVLRLRTSAIDLIHSERVSTSTSSSFDYRMAYSSHVPMIMPKFWCVDMRQVRCIFISQYLLYFDDFGFPIVNFPWLSGDFP